MIRTAFILFCMISISVACRHDSKNAVKVPPLSSRTCYAYSNGKDTVLLDLINVAGDISGTLTYSYFEKDRNTGTIKGTISNDLLIAEYTFRSEGVLSVRTVAFKRSGNTMAEGYGQIITSGTRTTFKDPTALRFAGSFNLYEVACK